ncbi:hypothetical protein ACFX11_043687 [Malus domestica]
MQSLAYLPSCTRKTYRFLMKLQNAEDNEYEEGVEPTLEFVMTKKEITGSGAPRDSRALLEKKCFHFLVQISNIG